MNHPADSFGFRNVYGTQEINALTDGQKTESQKITRMLDWSDPELAKIERLRLLSDPGYPEWDVSYCWGRTTSGELVNVELPFSTLPKRNMMAAIIKHAQTDGVFAKRLGLFAAISTLN